MWKLLSLEYKKFRNNAVVDLFGLMFLITMPTVIFIGKQMSMPKGSPFQIDTIYQFPKVWEYMGYSTSWLVFFFMGFIVLTMITSEVGYKTMRQNIITGMTRKDYFLGKVLVILVLSVVSTILYTVITLGIGAFHAEEFIWSEAIKNDYAILRCFLMCMGYLSFALMIGFLIRRSGIAIFSYVCYIIFIEMMLKWVVHAKIINNASINYWPMNTIEDLFPWPQWRDIDKIPAKGIDFDFLLSNQHAMIFSTLYICIFLFVAYRSFMTRDI